MANKTLSTGAPSISYGGREIAQAPVDLTNLEVKEVNQDGAYSDSVVASAQEGTLATAEAPSSVTEAPHTEANMASMTQTQTAPKEAAQAQAQTPAAAPKAPTAPAMAPKVEKATQPAKAASGYAADQVTASAEPSYANEAVVKPYATQQAPQRTVRYQAPIQKAPKAPKREQVKVHRKPKSDEAYIPETDGGKIEIKHDSGARLEGPARHVNNRQRAKAAADTAKNDAREATHAKTAIASANNVTGKIVVRPFADIGINDISIGTNLLLECVRQEGNVILDRVNAAAKRMNANTTTKDSYEFDNWSAQDFMLDQENTNKNLYTLMDQINRMALWVTVTKSPTTIASSYQARVLRVHDGDGFLLHPLAVKAFNADFDGDGTTIHFSTEYLPLARSGIFYLIDQDGSSRIDEDYFLRMDILDTETEDLIKDLFDEHLKDVTYQTRKIAGAYIEFCKGGSATEMVRQVNDIITKDNLLRNRPKALAATFERMYSAIQETYRTKIAESGLVESDYKTDAERIIARDLNTAEAAVLGIMTDARRGKMPPNYQEFVTQCGVFVGDVKKKNTQFRIGANISKMIKRSEKVYIGEEGMYELWHDTAMAAMSTCMNSRAYAGENTLGATTWLRKSVMDHMESKGMRTPGDIKKDDRGNFRMEEWVAEFARAWNRAVAVVNVARKQVDTSWHEVDPARLLPSIMPQNGRYTYDMVTRADGGLGPLQTVYGDFSLYGVFGDNLLWDGREASPDSQQYDSWHRKGTPVVLHRLKTQSLFKFCGYNEVRIPTNIRKQAVLDSKDGMWNLFAALADSASGGAAKFHKDTKDFGDAMQEIHDKWIELKGMTKNNFSKKRLNEIYAGCQEKWFEILRGMNPAMFGYFNLDQVENFFESPYGRQILRDPKNAMSVRMAMVFRWRTDRLYKVNARIKEADETTIGEYRAQLEHEAAALASSSPAWKAIVSETRNGSQAFKRFMETKQLTRKGLNGASVQSHAIKCGFFERYQDAGTRWGTISKFMSDLTVPYEMKLAVICDMVIETGGFISTMPETIAYQLELGANVSYATPNIGGWNDGGNPSVKGAMSDIRRQRERFQKFQDKLEENKKRAAKEGKPEKTVDSWNLRDEQIDARKAWYRAETSPVSIPWEILSDFILSPMEKTSEDSEKSSQTALTNAGFDSIVKMLDGTLTTEVQYCDNQAMGRIAWYQLTPNDVVDAWMGRRVIRYYDQAGNIGILDKTTVSDDFFRKNPQLFSLTNMTRVDVMPPNKDKPDSEGSTSLVYWGEDWSRKGGTTRWNALADHPGWYALIAMFTPIDSHTIPNRRTATFNTAMQLDEWMRWIGNKIANKERIDPRSIKWVQELNDFLDADRRKWGQDAFTQNLGDTAWELLTKYAIEMGYNVKGVYDSDKMPEIPKWTKASCNLFYDTRQTTSGAKTALSTGTEGYETERHKLICGYLPTLKDCYRDINEIPEQDQARLSGAPTTAGTAYVPGMTSDSPVFVVDTEMDQMDPMLDNDKATQVNAVMRWFNIKRDMSGEGLNLKAKKTGDDGKDSIMKKRKYGPLYADYDWFEAWCNSTYSEMVEAGADPNMAIERIRQMVAERYQKADMERDFVDPDTGETMLSLADYMNIARLVTKVGPEGQLILTSLEQLSAMIANEAPKYMDLTIDFEDNSLEGSYMQDFYMVCERLIDNFVPGEASTVDALKGIRKAGPAKPNVSTARRKRVSSLERNLKFYETKQVAPFEQLERWDKANRAELQNAGVNMNKCSKEFNVLGYVVDGVPNIDKRKLSAGFNNVILFDFANMSHKEAEALLRSDEGKKVLHDTLALCDEYSMTFYCSSRYFRIDYDEKRFEFRSVGYKQNETELTSRTDGFTIRYAEKNMNDYSPDTQFSNFHVPMGSVVWTVEDPHNRFDYADAGIVTTQQFLDRINVDDVGTWSMPIDQAFADTMARFDGYKLGFRPATAREIRDEISVHNIDLGVTEDNRYRDKVLERTHDRINEFYANWDGESSFLSEARPDRVIGFMCCGYQDPITLRVQKIFRPVIPFDVAAGGEEAPAEFRIDSFRFNPETGRIEMDYTNTATMAQRTAKYHEGWAAANKGMLFGEGVETLKFANGVNVDTFVAAQTTANRLCGDNKRVATIQNPLFEIVTPGSGVGWNAANIKGFLGGKGNKELLAKARRQPLTFEEWETLRDAKFFTGRTKAEKELNAFVQETVRKLLDSGVNPTPLFFNQFDTEEGPVKAFDAFEWEALMETDFDFEDMFLKLLHRFQPDLVPDGIYGDAEGCLYKVCTDAGPDFGCLLKWVPYPGTDMGTYEVVRANYGMFGQDASVHKRIGYNGSRIENQSLLESVHSNKSAPGARLQYMRYALSGSVPSYLSATSRATIDLGRRV